MVSKSMAKVIFRWLYAEYLVLKEFNPAQSLKIKMAIDGIRSKT